MARASNAGLLGITRPLLRWGSGHGEGNKGGSRSAHQDERVRLDTARDCGTRPFESLKALFSYHGRSISRQGTLSVRAEQAQPLRRSLFIFA